jgi:hypothetical protein
MKGKNLSFVYRTDLRVLLSVGRNQMSYEELAVSQQAGLIMQGRDRLYRGRRENTTVLFMENRLLIKISVG